MDRPYEGQAPEPIPKFGALLLDLYHEMVQIRSMEESLVAIYRQSPNAKAGESSFKRVRLHQLRAGDWFIRVQDNEIQHCYANADAYLDPDTKRWTVAAKPAEIHDLREDEPTAT